jgi:hypothetical protein
MSNNSDQEAIAEVKYGRFVPPWVSELPIETTVTEDLTVEIGLEELPLIDPPFDPQTKVKVYLHDDSKMVAKDIEQVKKEETKRKQRREKAKKARKRNEMRNTRIKKEARAEFWNQYDIPVDFIVVDNVRIGELQKGSTGTGRTEHTVDHLMPLEPFEDGRLKREANEFLCKNKGKYWDIALHDEDPVEDPDENTRKVTCKACLQLMERWKQSD